MSMTAEAPERRIVGKKQLCEALGWSRMKLDRRLDDDDMFPVVTRGTQSGGWEFDVDVVEAYLEPEIEREEVAEDLNSPAGIAARAELTARQRRDLAQAQLHEDKLRRLRGDLVEVADLRMALSEAVTRTSTSLNSIAETLVRRLKLPETAIPVIQQEVDEVRRQLVAGLRAVRTDG